MSKQLNVSNGHVDSLIEFVLDVKPFHTKLSEVVEEYLFEDTVNVSVADNDPQEMVVLGMDYLGNSQNVLRNVWQNAPLRPDSSLIANRTTLSDGRRAIYPYAPVLVNKHFSEHRAHTHTITALDKSDIPGNPIGVISHRRFEGPGPAFVTKNGAWQTEGVHYHVGLGAFSFSSVSGAWRQSNFSTGTYQSGALAYEKVKTSYGQIKNISWLAANYEEWVLTWNSTSSNLSVVGSVSGNIGNATVDVPFVHAKISFTFSALDGQPAGIPAGIVNGNKFYLTPSAKITINPLVADESWTIIKTNPQAITAAPVFVGAAGVTPNLSIYTRGCERAPAGTYTIVFNSDTQFTLSSSVAITGYPKTGTVDAAFKDDFLHFKIYRNGRTFVVGDTFTFTVKATKQNYLVYGSVSGWQTPATAGQWYWNGKIGFKIPVLGYFVCMNGDVAQPLESWYTFTPTYQPLNSSPPSKYDITFRNEIPYYGGMTFASVFNNEHGWRKGLEPDVAWSDEYCAWTIGGIPIVNEQITVLVGHRHANDQSFEPLTEYFPLYHSHGSVIFSTASVNDAIVIEKVERDYVRLNITEGDGDITALQPDAGWIPLDFRYVEQTYHEGGYDDRPFDSHRYDEDYWYEYKEIHFPDHPPTVVAFSAMNPHARVFGINNGDPANIELDAEFMEYYLPTGTVFTLRFHQNSSWAQVVRVKVSEDLVITNTNLGTNGFGATFGQNFGT